MSRITNTEWIDYHIDSLCKEIDYLNMKLDFLKLIKKEENIFNDQNYTLTSALNLELKEFKDEDIIFKVSHKRPKSKITIRTIEITEIKLTNPIIKNNYRYFSNCSFDELLKNLKSQINFFEKFSVINRKSLFLMEDIVKKYKIKPNNKSQENFIKSYYKIMNYNIGVVIDFVINNGKPFPFHEDSDFLGKKEIVSAYLRSDIFKK